jgi:hypothetical protein
MKTESLRDLAATEMVGYAFLMSALKSYAAPRDKITKWIGSGDLIRVKKAFMSLGLKWHVSLTLQSSWPI